nr:MAG TPA: hypothetical protein [Caudoviricetes sp.]
MIWILKVFLNIFRLYYLEILRQGIVLLEFQEIFYKQLHKFCLV